MTENDVAAETECEILTSKKSTKDPATEIGKEKETESAAEADLRRKIRREKGGGVKEENAGRERRESAAKKTLKKFELKKNQLTVVFWQIIFMRQLTHPINLCLLSDYPDYNEDYMAENIAIKYEDAEKIVKKQERDRDLGNGHMYNNYGNHENHDDQDEEEGEDYS